MEVNRMEGGGYRFASPEAVAQPVKDGVSAVREPAESVRGETQAFAEARKTEQDEVPMGEREQQKRMELLADTLKHHNIEISYNEDVNRYAIKVLDAETKEVVREIPSEKSLEMFAKMMEIEGILVDERR